MKVVMDSKVGVDGEAVTGKPLGGRKNFTRAAQTDVDVARVAYGSVNLMKVMRVGTFMMVDEFGAGGDTPAFVMPHGVMRAPQDGAA
jgi:hypothetical protein